MLLTLRLPTSLSTLAPARIPAIQRVSHQSGGGGIHQYMNLSAPQIPFTPGVVPFRQGFGAKAWRRLLPKARKALSQMW